jgi:predicted CoA-binding protein
VRTPAEILREARTIAVVGASPKPDRPSHGVMRYLLAQGYDVIPVRPVACDEVLGVPCVRSLAETDRPIDLVDVFRRAELTPPHAQEAAAVGAGALWLQLGVVSAGSRAIAEQAGLDYVETSAPPSCTGTRSRKRRSAGRSDAQAPACTCGLGRLRLAHRRAGSIRLPPRRARR